MIDVHTHLWNPEAIPESIRSYFKEQGISQFHSAFCTADGLLERMDEAGIQRAVVLALAYSSRLKTEDLEQINAYVLKETGKTKRLKAFCTVNPYDGIKALTMLRRCIEDQGFAGLKLHGSMQEVFPNDKVCYALYEQMQRYGKPVLFHTGGIGLKAYKDKYSRLENFDDMLCDFPEMPIILGHAGRFDYEGLAVLLRKHKNCYGDISTNFGKKAELATAPLERLIRTVEEWAGDTSHLLFGSDFPFYSQKRTVEYTKQTVMGQDLTEALEKNTDKFCEHYKIFQ